MKIQAVATDVELKSPLSMSCVSTVITLAHAGHVDVKSTCPTGRGQDTALGHARVSVRRFLTIKQC